MASNLRFREVQHFRQPWLWLFLGLTVLAVVWEIPRKAGIQPLDVVGLVIFAVVILVFFFVELDTEVTDEQVEVRFSPFFRRRWQISDISSCESVTYRPLLDLGGWGLRRGPGRGSAYTVSGNRGVRLSFSDGKQVLIGSQRADELAEAIGASP